MLPYAGRDVEEELWNRCVQVEAELRELDPVEAAEYLESLGAREGGLAGLIRAAYRLLGLRTYFTTGARLQGLPIMICPGRLGEAPHCMRIV